MTNFISTQEGQPMGTVTHIIRNVDLQTDTMIRLDNLDSMITILDCGICGEGISIPT